MKKLYIILLSIVTTIMCSIFAIGCTAMNVLKKDKEEVKVVTAAESDNTLFSFESYDDLFNCIYKTYNRIGKYGVSDEHVTDGKKSMKVEVVGKYDGTLPGMSLYCSGTSFKSGDFSKYTKIAIDVYNANDKTLSISTYFNLTPNAGGEKTFNTEAQTFELKANSATTIELTVPNVGDSYDLKKVNYIQIDFLESKTSKADKANVYYFDNVRGI